MICLEMFAVSDNTVGTALRSERERRALATAFWLNVMLAGSLMITGVSADSSGLIANALDNTSDAAVYAISYYAVTWGERWKTRAAQVSGVMLFVLCLGVLGDVARRFIVGAEPVSRIMIVMTILAAAINVVTLKLLQSRRRKDVNLRAAWTFSINDFVSNVGVLVAALLVAWLGRAWPDLVAGLGIALVTGRGGIQILMDARRTMRALSS